MKKIKTIGLAFAILVVVLGGFITWYNITYSQSVISSFEVGDSNSPSKLLIASQGSEFKDILVKKLVSKLKENQIYIKVVDATTLSKEETEWDAIVVMNSIEIFKMQKDAKTFIESINDKSKIVLINTAGDESGFIDKEVKVDTLTSASKNDELKPLTETILKKIGLILKK